MTKWSLLVRLVEAADLPKDDIWCLFVIGHYTGRISHPDLIQPFLDRLAEQSLDVDWAICAFAEEENESLAKAVEMGGKLRVGFENSLFMPDGTVASGQCGPGRRRECPFQLTWPTRSHWTSVGLFMQPVAVALVSRT